MIQGLLFLRGACTARISIKILQPAIYVLENVFTLSSKDEEGQDFTLMQQHMQEELPNFAHRVNDKVDPVQKGYAMRRTRLLMTGGRGGCC